MHKLYILLSAALLMMACSDETTDKILPNTLEMGQTSIVTKDGTPLAADAWTWKNGDKLTATAGGLSSSYTYLATNKWGTAENTGFTKETIGLSEIILSFGNKSLTANQTDIANYRKADYMTGKGTLNHLTINGTLAHQYTDLVVTFTKGKGWTSEKEFNDAIAAAGFKINPNIIPYHDKAIFRAIVPPASVPNTGQLGTLTFGTTPSILKGRTAQVTYTKPSGDLTGTCLTVNVTLNLDCSVSTTITFKLWDSKTISSLPAE